MRGIFLALVAIVLFASGAGNAHADPSTWTFVLRPNDIVVGPKLDNLPTRRHWNGTFDERDGKFEIAVRKSAFPVAAPQCRMGYLILGMPLYYPENPKQAPLAERRAVFDALLAMQTTGKSALSVHVEALEYARQGPSGPELTTCNIYFVLPLAKDAGKLIP